MGEDQLPRGAAMLPEGKRRERLIGQVDATARAHGAAMATRNMGDFEGFAVELVDPWIQKQVG